jgi:PQQ-dependent dehydrogenase (methanol/ethanol family)
LTQLGAVATACALLAACGGSGSSGNDGAVSVGLTAANNGGTNNGGTNNGNGNNGGNNGGTNNGGTNNGNGNDGGNNGGTNNGGTNNGGSIEAQSAACCTATGKDFPMVGGNYGNQRYSTLNQITKGNIGKLGGAWLTHIEGGSTAQRQNSTPVAIDGVLYLESGQGGLFAIDGKTGEIKWRFNRGYVQQRRGVAVGGGLVYSVIANNGLVAVNKDTGTEVWRQTYPGVGNVQKVAITYYDGRLYMGTNDATARSAALMINAQTGELLSTFFGARAPGEVGGTGPDGKPSWEGTSYLTAGAAPWMHPAIDPDLNLVYWTFGNARGSNSPVDGTQRKGANLFANSIVALDAKTGEYKWHFQSVIHDIWDMDNVMSPLLIDFAKDGKTYKAVVYGSKSGMNFILDRATGKPITPVEYRAVPQSARQGTWPVQPFSVGDPLVSLCPGEAGSGADNEAVPNYQVGCLYTPHEDFTVLQSPGTGGGNDWAGLSYSPRTRLFYSGYGEINSAHSIPTGNVGFRPLGERKGGGVLAKDPKTNKIVWKKDKGWSLTHGDHILTTAGDVLFIGMPDGNFLGMAADTGDELFRFQTGASVHTGAITYEVDGEQYVAVLAGGNQLPYADTVQGDALWAFKVGGTMSQVAEPSVLPSKRQPIAAAAVEGSAVNNTIVLARNYANGAVSGNESTSLAPQQNYMAPQHLRVPVGTTVTFSNPANNALRHCATQFYEKKFNFTLLPGQSATYTFREAGEYFYNDCENPQTTGKVVVY